MTPLPCMVKLGRARVVAPGRSAAPRRSAASGRPAATSGRLAAPSGRLAGPRRLTALLAFAFCLTSAGLLSAPAVVLAWDPGTFDPGSEGQLITLQNQARASAGLGALSLDTALRTIARWRSQDMVDRSYFSHTILGTGNEVFWYMQNTYHYCFRSAGENIGTITWPGASVTDATNWVFNAFMNSPGHRGNIMGAAWDVVAVGAYKGAGDTFMWTVLFAQTCSSTPTAAPTPKPTPAPTPRPTVAPTPTTRAPSPAPTQTPAPTPSPAPTRTSAPAPTSAPTRIPAPAPTPTVTATSTPTPTPSVFGAPTAQPAAPAPATALSGQDPTLAPTVGPTAGATPAAPVTQLRVLDPQTSPSLVNAILDRVSAQFFGG